MDTQVQLPILDLALPLAEVLKYHQTRAGDLQQARKKLGWMARRIEAETWSADFAKELEHKIITDLAKELEEARKARDSWLESKRGRLALSAAGLGVGVAAAMLAVFAGPIMPIALAATGLGLVSGRAIPGAKWLFDWRDGKKSVQENGLHYLLKV